MQRCRACDARISERATFCDRCHVPVRTPDDEVAGFMTEVEAVAGRWRAPRSPAEAWRPHERHVAPAPQRHRSRWRASSVTYGPGVRVALTILIVAGLACSILLSPVPASGFVLLPVTGWALRDIWRATPGSAASRRRNG
jgi:hypothetical protein